MLLIGVLAAAVLVLLLAADLLARRRTPALIAARQRGAALPDLGAELLHRVGAGRRSPARRGGAGAGPRDDARARPGGGRFRWCWSAAAVGGPAFGVSPPPGPPATGRVPANRAARRFAAPHRPVAARRRRGRGPGRRGRSPWSRCTSAAILPSGSERLAALPASAPALGGPRRSARPAAAGARSAPGVALRRALRSRRPLAVFGAARAAATSARALPLLVLVAATALAAFALTLDATADRGLADGAWQTVGADARLDVASTPPTPPPPRPPGEIAARHRRGTGRAAGGRPRR